MDKLPNFRIDRDRLKSCGLAALLLLSGSAILWAQTAPPTLQSVSPTGASQGKTTTILVDGLNLEENTRILFNGPGIEARVVQVRTLPNRRRKPREGEVVTSPLIEDRSTRNRLTVEVQIADSVKPDVYLFRMVTPLGVTNSLPFAVTAFPEVDETQRNDTLEQAQPLSIPVTVKGEISELGDLDHFRFESRTGQELVFEIVASKIGSRLNARLLLLDESGTVVASNDASKGRDSFLAYRFNQAGSYIIQVSDAHMGRGLEYRLQIGEFPYQESVFPLGVQAGRPSEVRVRGYNLGGKGTGRQLTLKVKEQPSAGGKPVPLTVPGALNELALAVGDYAEDFEREPNSSVASAQPLKWPVTVNGRIAGDPSGAPLWGRNAAGGPDEDYFRFSARRGQQLILEVEAQRLGSELDSVIEVLDEGGSPLPRATLRCIAQTAVTLNDPDSLRSGIRVQDWKDFAIDDYVLIGAELLQIESLPAHPDADMVFKNFRGRRIAFQDTTPEAHALNTPVYKVGIFPSGTDFPPTGMPVVHLNYRNDDGGPRHGKDSRLAFTAPRTGDYLVRIRDVRGEQGERYSYRLTIREPAPDFVLFSDREILNIAPGGQVPVTVSAYRIDGFDGEIEVALEGLPAGFRSQPARIASGSHSTVVLVHAGLRAQEPAPFRIVGKARVGPTLVRREVDLKGRLALVTAFAPSELQVHAGTQRVTIRPGAEAEVTLSVERRNGFSGRVPFNIRNLPHGVSILDIGLNGVMITEEETSRTFRLYAEPWLTPGSRPFYAVGRVETTSPIPVEVSSDPIELVVVSQRAEKEE